MSVLNETHDPSLKSWVASANAAGSDFPIQNLPFAVFRRNGSPEAFRGGVAIGEMIVDLGAVARLLDGVVADAARAGSESSLNALMAQGSAAWSALRLALSRALREGALQQAAFANALVAQADAEYTVPARIGDYTDFYTSIYHATNIGRLFRPDNPLMPNYKWVPIGYHGRASSIAVSGQQFPRPVGQTFPPGSEQPSFGPSKRLDYELELAVYIGTGNALGSPIPIDDAEAHVFGIGLLNDWSARDVQAWEYQPLGPFLAKSFASTVSPWIVTLEALARVLDDRADGRASHGQRLQPAAGRPAWHGHAVGSDAGPGGRADRDHERRQEPVRARQWRGADFPRGRRCGDHPWMVREGGCGTHRLRRVSWRDFARACGVTQ